MTDSTSFQYSPEPQQPTPPRFVRLRLLLFLAGVFFPILSAATFSQISFEEVARRESTSGLFFKILFIKSLLFFSLPLVFSICSYTSFLITPNAEFSSATRFGIYSGLFLSLQLAILSTLSISSFQASERVTIVQPYFIVPVAGLVSLLAFWPFLFLGMSLFKSFYITPKLSVSSLMMGIVLVCLIVGSVTNPEGVGVLFFLAPVGVALFGAFIPCILCFAFVSYILWKRGAVDYLNWKNWTLYWSTYFLFIAAAWTFTIDATQDSFRHLKPKKQVASNKLENNRS